MMEDGARALSAGGIPLHRLPAPDLRQRDRWRPVPLHVLGRGRWRTANYPTDLSMP